MKTSLSMNINGAYIEDSISGFTIINVTGREMLSKTNDTVTIGTRKGSFLKNIRYESRTITISFVLESDISFFDVHTNWKTSLYRKLSNLSSILNTENARIIFDDEPDVYYIGTPIGSPEVELALGVASGSFDIYCEDPFKYSVEGVNDVEAEYIPMQTGTDSEFLGWNIDYEGTAPASPKFTVEFYDSTDRSNSSNVPMDGSENEELDCECGYVSIHDDEGNVLLFGDPNQKDEKEVNPDLKNITMVDQYFTRADSWSKVGGTTSSAKWRENYINSISDITDNKMTAWKVDGYVDTRYRDVTTGSNEVYFGIDLLHADRVVKQTMSHYTLTGKIEKDGRKATSLKITVNGTVKISEKLEREYKTYYDQKKPTREYFLEHYNEYYKKEGYPVKYVKCSKTDWSIQYKKVSPSKSTFENNPKDYYFKKDTVNLISGVSSAIDNQYTHCTKASQWSSKRQYYKRVVDKKDFYKPRKELVNKPTLKGVFLIGSDEIASVTIKNGTDDWGKNKEYKFTKEFTIYDLESSDDQINNLYFRVDRTDSLSDSDGVGSLPVKKCNKFDLPKYKEPTDTMYLLTFDDTAAWELDKYVGPTVTRFIGKSAKNPNDTYGANRWNLTWNQYLSIGDYTNAIYERGGFCAFVLTGTPVTSGNNVVGLTNPKAIAGIDIRKGVKGTRANLRYWTRKSTNGSTSVLTCVRNDSIESDGKGMSVSYHNTNFGHKDWTKSVVTAGISGPFASTGTADGPNSNIARSSYILKDGLGFAFKIGDQAKFRFNFSAKDKQAGVHNMRAYAIMFGFFNYSTYTGFRFNGISKVTFTKNNLSTEDYDIYNTFQPGDILEIDTSSGDVRLNESRKIELGALGNDWENIVLTPGKNVLVCSFSDWLNKEKYYRPVSKKVGSTIVKEEIDMYAYENGLYFYSPNGTTFVQYDPSYVEDLVQFTYETDYDYIPIVATEFDEEIADAFEYVDADGYVVFGDVEEDPEDPEKVIEYPITQEMFDDNPGMYYVMGQDITSAHKVATVQYDEVLAEGLGYLNADGEPAAGNRAVTSEEYYANPDNYYMKVSTFTLREETAGQTGQTYILETCAPKFKLSYEEAFL